MKAINIISLYFLTCFFWSLGMAQVPPKENINPEQLIERLFPIQDDDIDYEAIYEVLFQLYSNPIDINRAEAERLLASYFLSPDQVNNLIEYRTNYGDFISLYELQAIPGFDLKTIEQIIPFITLGSESTKQSRPFWQRVINEEQAYLLFRHRRVLETRKGFTPADTSSTGRISSRYLGDPNDLYLRFRIQHARDFSLGFTLDKDAGEQFTWDRKTARYGFNFLSFHFTRYQVGKWRAISLGDFQVSFGQGLVFGAGYSLGKGAETVPTVRRSSIGITPYTAALEFGFFRGVGATYRHQNWQSTFILSVTPRDGRAGTALDTLENTTDFISSFNQSGLHRTASELQTKNRFIEWNLGSNIQYNHERGKFHAGANFLNTRFDRPWLRTPTPYNQYEFSGSANSVGSLYANYNWKNFYLFGESALSKSGGSGTVLGFISSLSKQVDFSFLWRNYDRDFHSFYGNAFSEGTRAINERGIYLGIQIKPNMKWKINSYYDFFKFPWLRYRVYAPSDGYEWLTRISFSPNRNLIAFFQIRKEQKGRNITNSGEPASNYRILPIEKTNGMVSLEYQIDKQLFIRSRILFSQVNFNGIQSPGFMVLQDAQYDFGTFRLTGRVALFDAKNYENRLYVFENNVLWTFSVPAFFGQGMRYYLIGQCQFSSQLTAYFRFARTSYSDRSEISSGLQKISKPHQTESTFLIRYLLHR